MTENNTKTRCSCSACSSFIQTAIENKFSWIGKQLATHPWKFLIFGIILNVGLGVGLITVSSDSDIRIYTPANSEAAQDESKMLEMFPNTGNTNYESNQLITEGIFGEIIILSKDGSNILTQNYIDEVNAIDFFIRNNIWVADWNSRKVGFNNVCQRASTECAVIGNVFLSTSFQSNALINNLTFPFFGQYALSSVLAKPKSQNGRLLSANGVKFRYYLNQNVTYLSTSKLWEKEFIRGLTSLRTNLTKIAFSNSAALNEELNSNTKGDIKFFSVTFVLMITYACVVSSSMNGNNVANRMNLGSVGVYAAGLAILGAFGLASLCKIEFVNIVGVLPFLIIGIGIDNVFIVMSGMAETFDTSDGTVDRIKVMMRKSGVAITITSLTDFLAFIIGYTSVFKSVRNFCAYSGIAVCFCYLNQLLIFVPCIAINEQRVNEFRHCCVCWKKIKPKSEYDKEKRSNAFLLCCTGNPPLSRADVEGPMEKYPKQLVKFIMRKNISKIFIIIMYLGYLAAAIYGTINLQQGLSLFNLVSKDSFYYKFSTWEADFFDQELIITFTVPDQRLYSKTSTQNIITSTLLEAKRDKSIKPNFEINWLSEYTTAALYNDSSETAFVSGLKSFLMLNPRFENDVVFSSRGTSIKYSRFYLMTNRLQTSTEQGEMMLRIRKVAKNSAIPFIAYAPPFIFFEQYVKILPSTLQTVGIAVAVMIFITIVFMPYLTLVMLVRFTLVSILVGIFGFMYYWDLTLSSVTMIHLIMTVGFSVDFSAHICHSFLVADGEEPADKLQNSLESCVGAIVNAAASSLLGIFMLVFSTSYIFQSFAKLMFLVMMFGLLHAVFLLPIMLEFIEYLGTLRAKISVHALRKTQNISRPLSELKGQRSQ